MNDESKQVFDDVNKLYKWHKWLFNISVNRSFQIEPSKT